MADLLNRFGPVVDINGLGVEQIAKALSAYEPDGLATYLDAGMVAYADVAEALHLPFHSAATAAALTDKAEQRQVLALAGLPMPASQVIHPDDAPARVAEVGSEVGWPAVLKPRSAQGSRYTFLAQDRPGAGSTARGAGSRAPGDGARGVSGRRSGPGR